MENSRITLAREKYKPEKVKLLLIGEAPPSIERFFYFENVEENSRNGETRHVDNLFKEIIEVLCGKCDYESEEEEKEIEDRIKKNKWRVLECLKEWGLFLIDLTDNPIGSRKMKNNWGYDKLELRQPFFKNLAKLQEQGTIDKTTTNIIIVKSSVYDYLHDELKDRGYKVSDCNIWFPSVGKGYDNRPKFRQQLTLALTESDCNINELSEEIRDVLKVNISPI